MSPVMEAHLRLLETLPKRTHEFKPREVQGPSYSRPLIVHGRKFDSVRDAHRALGVSRTKIYNMLDDGRAEYLESK